MNAMMVSNIACSFARLSSLKPFSSSPTLAAFAACSGSGMRRSEELFNIAFLTLAAFAAGTNPHYCALDARVWPNTKMGGKSLDCWYGGDLAETVVGLYPHPGFVCATPIPRSYLYALRIDPPIPALLIKYSVLTEDFPAR